jgi:hypothetical protein
VHVYIRFCVGVDEGIQNALSSDIFYLKFLLRSRSACNYKRFICKLIKFPVLNPSC